MDLDKLLKAAGSDNVGKNAGSIMGMLQEGNKVLTELQKSTNMLNKMGVFPAMVRIAGKKFDVDVETPLKTAEGEGITPKSDTHSIVLQNINNLGKDDLKKFATALKEYNDKNAVKKSEKATA